MWGTVQVAVMSDCLWPNGLQHARLPCPSPPPRVCKKSCPLSPWSHPTILSPVIPFSSYLQSFPASGSFPMSQLFASGGQSIRDSASACTVDWRMNSNSSTSAHFPSPSLLLEARLPGRKWYGGKWSLSLTRIPEECGGWRLEEYIHPLPAAVTLATPLLYSPSPLTNSLQPRALHQSSSKNGFTSPLF